MCEGTKASRATSQYSSTLTTNRMCVPSVALLEGSTTTTETLSGNPELLQFWRVLSGMVTASSTNDGRRVDLLGCRVVEAPREGAALLKELWVQTAVPFAAADDAQGGYMLAAFLEEPNSRTLSLICSTVQGIDIYFNRSSLLSMAQPTMALIPQQQQMYASPTTPDPSQFSSVTPSPLSAPPLGSSGGVAPVLPQQQLQLQQSAAPLPQEDIFRRFVDRVAASGSTLPEVFNKYDVDKSGQLTQTQVWGGGSVRREQLADSTEHAGAV